MANKEDILNKIRKNIKTKYDMPRLDDIQGITYPDPLAQFISMTETVGGKVVELVPGKDINELVRELYPEAKEIASNLPEVTIATRNPDTCGSPQALNGTDVGIIRGVFHLREPGYPAEEVGDSQQHARGIQTYRDERLWLWHFHQWSLENR